MATQLLSRGARTRRIEQMIKRNGFPLRGTLTDGAQVYAYDGKAYLFGGTRARIIDWFAFCRLVRAGQLAWDAASRNAGAYPQ